jgi:uncharacterized protein (TIGR02246 family)
MRIVNAVALVACLSLIPVSSEGQDGTALPQGEVRKIHDVSEAFAKAVLSGDWKTVAALYVDDAVLYPPDEAAVKGRTAIQACLAGLPAMTDFKLRNTRVEGRDDLAYVQGTYSMTIATPGASEPVQESGYFVEIRRRQPDGRWLIAVHMLNSHR